MKLKQTHNYWRVVDANFNRAKEGLRVCEDVCRFMLNDESLTDSLKNIRHQLSDILFAWNPKDCWDARDVSGDVGQKSLDVEFKRETLADVTYANIQRVKESIRVLEEFAKLDDVSKALAFKQLRYEIYIIEKDLVTKVSALSGA